MSKLLDHPIQLEQRRQHTVSDDFMWYISPHMWTSLAADTNATVSLDTDGTGGILQIYTGDATDNNEAGVRTTNEPFLFASDKPLIFEARVQFTEINTSAANILVGLYDALAANALVDDAGGPKTTFYGAIIYKIDGELVWRCASSVGAYATLGTVTKSTTTSGGSSYQTLRIEALPVTSTTTEITYFVDGVQLRDANDLPIKHTVTNGNQGTADMGCVAYAKAGGASSLTLQVDYITCSQLR